MASQPRGLPSSSQGSEIQIKATKAAIKGQSSSHFFPLCWFYGSLQTFQLEACILEQLLYTLNLFYKKVVFLSEAQLS